MMSTAINRVLGMALATLCATQAFAGDCCFSSSGSSGYYGQSAYSYGAAPAMNYGYSAAYTYPTSYSNYGYGNYGYTYPSAYNSAANYSYNYGLPAQTMTWQPMVLASAGTQSSGTQSTNCSGAAAANTETKASQVIAQYIQERLSSGKLSAASLLGEIDSEMGDRRDDGTGDVNSRLDGIDARLKKVEAYVESRKADLPDEGAAKADSRDNQKQLRKIRKRLDELDSKVQSMATRTDVMYGYLMTQEAFQQFIKK